MFFRALVSPVLFSMVVLGVLLLLALPLSAPVGPFYWDTLIYYDGAARIANGQIPSLDFMTPGGPLGYWLFYAVLQVFPQAQALYAASWMLLIVSGPLMAVVVYDVSRRSRWLAFALAAPFLLFSILPFNVEQYYPYPGADGYGIYNRQPAQLLYLLLAALLFVEARWARIICTVGCLVALFLIKITGLLAALPFVAMAFLAGRLSARQLLLVLVLFVLGIAGLEASSGVVGAYLRDIARLVELNDGSMIFALMRGISIHLAQIVLALMLAAALLVLERRTILSGLRTLVVRGAGRAATPAVFDTHSAWILVAITAGIVFESENWGGQAFIFLWPPVIRCLIDPKLASGRRQLVLGALAVSVLVPAIESVAGRAMRTYAAQLRYERLDAPELGPIASVSQHPESFERAGLLRELAVAFPDYYALAADRGRLPTYILYNEPDFQIAWLQAAAEAVAAIKAHEKETGTRFDTILSLNFVNPFPYLLQRNAPKHVSIGADPFRTVPPVDARTARALEETDLVLWPRCIETVANRRIRDIYASALAGRRTIALSPCWDGLVKADSPEGRSAPKVKGQVSSALAAGRMR
ncbi:hypothetical protein [Jiella pelagia]|uniref:Glycosyltransferase RgtA/B/C/D-like domain-containing protein n=1 Tax=Jiella pelagia TaxID=2986949 RepID=A0ABY7BWX1_9HYPH|nr:hypothetical protein [Jiella pelagia]WAP67883.1 hypothetical protein OH818_20925 [Jiella pelagia]